MKNLKTILGFIITVTALIIFLNQNSFSQDTGNKIKPTRTGVKQGSKISKETQLKNIRKNKNSFNKNMLRGSFMLEEDFETGNFPPSGWTVGTGGEEWNEFSVSAYGNGNYSTFFSNYNCNGSNNIYSPNFGPSFSGNALIFDFAYSPYGDENNATYDDLEVFYSVDNGSSWISLVYYEGEDLQTAPVTFNYFIPAQNEWGTKIVVIPSGTNRIKFQSVENCGNNIFIDNIRVDEEDPPVPLFADFESGNFPVNWSAGSDWEIADYSAYCVGDYSARYPFYNCNYYYGTLYTANFPPSADGDSLLFDRAYSGYISGIDSSADEMEIYYSTNYGIDFQLLKGYYGFDLQTVPAVNQYYDPGCDDWVRTAIVLPLGTTTITFNALDNCSNNLYLDNIRTSTLPPPPVTEVEVSAVYAKGRYPRTFLTSDTISANIRNNSNYALTNLKVYLRMTGANNLFDSVTVPNVPASTDYTVKIRPFTPIINGNSVVKVYISSIDDDPYNDTAKYNTNVNSNYFAYVDTTNNYNGGLGFFDPVYFLQKYRITNANSRITEVRYKVPNFDGNPIGQFIKGVVVNSAGVIVAKSEPYKIKAGDLDNFVSLKITNPIPFYPVTNNSYFYAGMETSEAVGGDFFWNATNQEEEPRRTGAFFMGFGGLRNIGQPIGFISDDFGKYGIEVQVTAIGAVDVGIASLMNTYDNYYSALTIPQTGKVFNNATSGTANATVIRKITPGAYTSSVAVSIPANSTANVTFTNFTFVSGTAYTIRDSIVLTGDVNLSNNVLSAPYTPRIAKSLLVLYQKFEDRDSMVRAINLDGRYANNFDTVGINYPGSFRPWKILFDVSKPYRVPDNNVRDSLKAFLDNSTAGVNKKTLVYFGNQIAYQWDPSNFATPADTVFLRQYLKAKYVNTNWLGNVANNIGTFYGKGFFNGITQDSLSYNAEFGDNENPDLIAPANGSSVAFLPNNVIGNGNDSAIAVSFTGVNYNTFFMSNRFSALRSSNSSPSLSMGPVRVYTKIIDWIQNIVTNVKVLDLTAEIEGFYEPAPNTMRRDTMRVYLRSSVNPYPKIDSAKAYLNAAGQASFVFSNASNGVGYYIQLKHRNGVETWSKTTQVFSAGHLAYNFTSDSAKSYGNNLKKSGSKWVVFTGDVNQDGFVDLTDVLTIYNDAAVFVSGYVKTDVNGDNVTDLTDVILSYNNSVAFVKKNSPLPEPGPMIFSKSEGVTDNLPQAGSKDAAAEEIKIDHEIYNKFKDEQKTDIIIPKYKNFR